MGNFRNEERFSTTNSLNPITHHKSFPGATQFPTRINSPRKRCSTYASLVVVSRGCWRNRPHRQGRKRGRDSAEGAAHNARRDDATQSEERTQSEEKLADTRRHADTGAPARRTHRGHTEQGEHRAKRGSGERHRRRETGGKHRKGEHLLLCSLSLFNSHFFLSENAKDTTQMERENCTNYFQPFQGWFGTTGKQSSTAPPDSTPTRVANTPGRVA